MCMHPRPMTIQTLLHTMSVALPRILIQKLADFSEALRSPLHSHLAPASTLVLTLGTCIHTYIHTCTAPVGRGSMLNQHPQSLCV